MNYHFLTKLISMTKAFFITFFTATLLCLTPAFASLSDTYPDNTLLVLKGEIGSVRKQDCFLYVTDFGYKGQEKKDDQFFATVLTSFNHKGDTPDPIEVKVTPKKTDTLSGKGSNGKDEILIYLDPKTLDLYNAKSFNLKWWHRNHFDTFRCTNLKMHKDFTVADFTAKEDDTSKK